MKKRVISFMLAVVIMIGIIPQFAVSADAASCYTINGVKVHHNDFPSKPNDCLKYANNLYKKIWGKNFNSLFSDPDNSLKNLSDSQLTLTKEHLKEYVTNAKLGSCLRICNSEYLHSNDGWGHSQIIVQKDSKGFTVLEGGLSASPYHR